MDRTSTDAARRSGGAGARGVGRSPPHILARAPQSPWIHPWPCSPPPAQEPDTPSHRAAREALPDGGTVLDVGCGGGRAAFALTPPAALVVGVDHQQAMLDSFAQAAAAAASTHVEVLGDWPDVAPGTPARTSSCAITSPTTSRRWAVRPGAHREGAAPRRPRAAGPAPAGPEAPLWRRFWGLERPVGPTAEDAARCSGRPGSTSGSRSGTTRHRRGRRPGRRGTGALARVRLCLPAERDPEVAAALAELGPAGPRRLATICWQAEAGRRCRPGGTNRAKPPTWVPRRPAGAAGCRP